MKIVNLADKKYGYGRQLLGDEDYSEVLATLKSDFLTQGPKVAEFESAIAEYAGAKYCVAVANGTAALHIAVLAAGIKKGDEALTSPNTFLASANCILYAGASVSFVDIEAETANLDVDKIESALTEQTRLLIPVHFAGQSVDMERIAKIARKYSLNIIEDAAHAIGSDYNENRVGSCKYSDMTTFSFHPVKTITSGEGGAITTNSEELYNKLLALRNHGMHRDGEMVGTWKYEMRELGFNYRMTDMQAALGLAQLRKISVFKKRRREIVEYYNQNLGFDHLIEKGFSNACFHLYPVLLADRDDFYQRAKRENLFLQVHYIPVHMQPYYQKLGFKLGDFPLSEEYYRKTVSLPLYPALSDDDVEEIVRRLKRIV